MSEPVDLTDDFEASYRALRGDGGLLKLERDLVSVTGPQATEFLQGQVSQDLASIGPGASRLSFLLQPTGKVDAWLRVTRRSEDEYLLDVDGGFGESVTQRLSRFKLRTKVDIEVLEGWQCWAMRRAAVGGWQAGGPEMAVTANWPARSGTVGGVDFLGTRPPNLGPDIPRVHPDAFEAVRIECGVPAMGSELTEHTIPAEAGQWIIDESVSFTKGCYTGQELVARIDSRGGNVPRHLRGVVIEGDPPPVGARVVVGDGEVGTLTSVGRSPDLGAIALAYVARRVDPPADAVVRWDGAEAAVRIQTLPLV